MSEQITWSDRTDTEHDAAFDAVTTAVLEAISGYDITTQMIGMAAAIGRLAAHNMALKAGTESQPLDQGQLAAFATHALPALIQNIMIGAEEYGNSARRQ